MHTTHFPSPSKCFANTSCTYSFTQLQFTADSTNTKMTSQVFFTSAIVAFFTIFTLFYIYAKRKLSYWKRRGVKTPSTNIIFGNFLDMFMFKKSPGEILQSIYEAAGPEDPYIGFYVFHKPMLMLRDHGLIKQVMVKDFDIFPNRQFGGERGIDSVGLENLLGINQPRWKYLRAKMTHLLTGAKVRAMLPLMEDSGKPLMGYLEGVKEDDDGWKEVELKNVCARYTTDVFWSLIFGVSTNSFAVENVAFWEAGELSFGLGNVKN